jgi:hypothetical protein
MDAAKCADPSSQKQNWKEKSKKKIEKLTVGAGAAAVHGFVTTVRIRTRSWDGHRFPSHQTPRGPSPSVRPRPRLGQGRTATTAPHRLLPGNPIASADPRLRGLYKLQPIPPWFSLWRRIWFLLSSPSRPVGKPQVWVVASDLAFVATIPSRSI